MEALPVIPTPPGQRWREFRITVLPVVVFLCTVVSIVYMWREHVSPPTFVAQAEARQAEVRGSDPGVIQNLYVTRFQRVRQGDPVARIVSTDARRIDAQLSLLRNQISLSQLQLGSALDRDRVAFDYHNLRLELMRERVELLTAEAEMGPAERDYRLALNLQESQLLSQTEVDAYARVYLPLKAKVEETEKMVGELEQQLEATAGLGRFSELESQEAALRDTLASLEEQRQALESLFAESIVLTAPIDGVVTFIYRQEGETIVAGDSLVTIGAEQSETLVGYLRQPLPFQPEPGMTVRLRTRTTARQEIEAQLVSVGAQFEAITNVALIRPGMINLEMGLPLGIAIPPGWRTLVRPGELVDATISAR